MEKLELLIKHIQNLECEYVNKQEVLNRLTEIDQALQLHKTQVSGSVLNTQLCKDCIHFENPKWTSKICSECFFYDNNQQSNFKHKVK